MGHLLDQLTKKIIPELPSLLGDSDIWRTGDIIETTRLERLSTPWEDGQIFLQHFLPTKNSILHSHPWPSAHVVLSGTLEMGWLPNHTMT